jgi:hypothetical protein
VRLLPGNLLSDAIGERSVPSAIILGSLCLALAWIVAAAVH